MHKLPSDFCAFILSHGRPDRVLTHKALRRHGYTGPVKIIIDNEDKTADQYRERFGAESVVVFDKLAEADRCDEGNNWDDRRVILMARNACFGIAEALGINHFIQLDDDYREFKFRFDATLARTWLVNDLDRAFASLFNFYRATPALTVAMSQGGDHIGGFCGVTKLKRKAMNSFFCSTDRPFRFVGAINEDVNSYTTLGSRGGLFFTFTSLQLDQMQTQSNANGMSDIYKRFGTYIKAFSTVIMAPSSVKVALMNSKYARIHHSVDWPSTVPCILREPVRKPRATEMPEASQ